MTTLYSLGGPSISDRAAAIRSALGLPSSTCSTSERLSPLVNSNGKTLLQDVLSTEPNKRQRLDNTANSSGLGSTSTNLNYKYQTALRRIIDLEEQTESSSPTVLEEDLMAARLQKMKEGKYLSPKEKVKPSPPKVSYLTEGLVASRFQQMKKLKAATEASQKKDAALQREVALKKAAREFALKKEAREFALKKEVEKEETVNECPGICTSTNMMKMIPFVAVKAESEDEAILRFARLIY
ncbi:expressed unknown protein [Seminavis robusta]|uniref:Uncharacterized protein n=1 Tax=Seminavis robusta TaxID=568900 RepID=A0A9N8DSE6_9STRA|nr:expressed unknown protein [Seminavis robusta]|eukprot:Sro337_g120480.1 n/a (240) ;mRNA; r:2031-2750